MMIDVLLTVVTGGTRTMYDALVSSAVFVVAQTYLQNLFKLGSDASVDRPRLATLLSPDRWLLAAVARRAVCAFSLLLPRQRGGEVARTALVVKNTPIFQRQPRRYA